MLFLWEVQYRFLSIWNIFEDPHARMSVSVQHNIDDMGRYWDNGEGLTLCEHAGDETKVAREHCKNR